MTGMRPDSTHVWSLGEEFRKTIPDVVTMPQHFHKYGYYTVSMGKIFHNHMPDRVSFDEPDLRPAGYDTPEMIDRDPESFYYDDELKAELAEVRQERLKRNPNAYAGGWAYGRSVEVADAPDDALYDGAQTELAIETLKRLKDKNNPSTWLWDTTARTCRSWRQKSTGISMTGKACRRRRILTCPRTHRLSP